MAHGCPQRWPASLALGLGLTVIVFQCGCLSNSSSKRNDAQARLPLPSTLPPPTQACPSTTPKPSTAAGTVSPSAMAGTAGYQRPGPAAQGGTPPTTIPGGISAATLPTTTGTHLSVAATAPARTPIASTVPTSIHPPQLIHPATEPATASADSNSLASAISQPVPPASTTPIAGIPGPSGQLPAPTPATDRWNTSRDLPAGGLRNFTPPEPARVSSNHPKSESLTPPDGKGWLHEVPKLPRMAETTTTSVEGGVIVPPSPLNGANRP